MSKPETRQRLPLQTSDQLHHDLGNATLGMFEALVADHSGNNVYGTVEEVQCVSPNECRVTLQNGEGKIEGVIFDQREVQSHLEGSIGKGVTGKALRGELVGIQIPSAKDKDTVASHAAD